MTDQPTNGFTNRKTDRRGHRKVIQTSTTCVRAQREDNMAVGKDCEKKEGMRVGRVHTSHK